MSQAPSDATHVNAITGQFFRYEGHTVCDYWDGEWRPTRPDNIRDSQNVPIVYADVKSVQPINTGLKYDTGKVLMGLIPPRAELAMAQVLTFGAQKYGPENWRKVENAQSRYLDALMRHLNSHRSGELVDAETGLSHLAHAMCCMSFLLELQLAREVTQCE